MRRGGSDDFFGGPFGNPFGNVFGNNPFGGRPGDSLISSVFGGRDPFDDPFFTQPFGSMMGPGMFGPSLFGSNGNPFGGNPFGGFSNSGFLQQQAPPPPQLPPSRSRGPIIEELESDEDDGVEEKKSNPRKHSRPGKEPHVQDPDDEVEEKKGRYMQPRSEFNSARAMQPNNQTFNFQSSTVTYHGPNGPYYTASTTRRMGGDGVVMEESKEADTATGKATHRISKGIHDKGHSLTRKLNSDGRVDSVQTLHNLNPDELPGFDEAWKGKAQRHLPGWNQNLDILGGANNTGMSTGGSRQGQHQHRRMALPSSEPPHRAPARVKSQSRNGPPSGRRY